MTKKFNHVFLTSCVFLILVGALSWKYGASLMLSCDHNVVSDVDSSDVAADEMKSILNSAGAEEKVQISNVQKDIEDSKNMDEFSVRIIEAVDYEESWCFVHQLSEDDRDFYYQELEDWQHAQGFFVKEDFQPYDGYSEDTLLSLAYQGDLLAIEILSQKYLSEHKDIVKYRAIRELSIISGSIFSISLRMNSLIREARELNHNDKQHEFNEFLGEAIIFSNLAIMRGSYSSSWQINHFLDEYEIEFDEEQLQQFKRHAQDLYDLYENERIQLGLGEFDNSIPKSVRVNNEKEIGKIVSKKKISSWLSSHIRKTECVEEYEKWYSKDYGR
ncbi:hypothetical protein [Sessilibacter corallicola]|uniref:DUF4034 domain-containing protein n=1 Tax=Sessilibacter corallicola TaxID=2904075 RepID=A0ABQ0A8R3_9GAMM